MSTTLAATRVGVLNASYQDLSPTRLSSALKLVLNGDAEIIEADENRFVRSKNGVDIPFPKVIRLLRYRNVPFTYAEEFFSKAGVLKRDNYTCGYCGKGPDAGLTMTHDHIHPKSRGGTDTWMNAITACTKCNGKKDDRTPQEAHMPLLFQPRIPMRMYFKSKEPRRKRR